MLSQEDGGYTPPPMLKLHVIVNEAFGGFLNIKNLSVCAPEVPVVTALITTTLYSEVVEGCVRDFMLHGGGKRRESLMKQLQMMKSAQPS